MVFNGNAEESMGPGKLLSYTGTIGEILQKSNQEAETRNGGTWKGGERKEGRKR